MGAFPAFIGLHPSNVIGLDFVRQYGEVDHPYSPVKRDYAWTKSINMRFISTDWKSSALAGIAATHRGPLFWRSPLRRLNRSRTDSFLREGTRFGVVFKGNQKATTVSSGSLILRHAHLGSSQSGNPRKNGGVSFPKIGSPIYIYIDIQAHMLCFPGTLFLEWFKGVPKTVRNRTPKPSASPEKQVIKKPFNNQQEMFGYLRKWVAWITG